MPVYSTGLELILNASEGVLQIAITDNEKPLCFQEWFAPTLATEILAGALKEICEQLHLKIDNFRRIGCFAGPGSFTGIRLVLSTAAALRRVTRAQLAGLNYLQALATSAVISRGLLYPAKVFVITHGRKNLVHFQEFCSYGPQIPAQPVNEISLISPEKALHLMANIKGFVCGSGLERNPEYFSTPHTGTGPAGAPELTVMATLTSPSLKSLCLLARHGDYFPKDIEPLYVRPCDAVENLPDIAAKQGLDINSTQEKLRSLLARYPKSDI